MSVIRVFDSRPVGKVVVAAAALTLLLDSASASVAVVLGNRDWVSYEPLVAVTLAWVVVGLSGFLMLITHRSRPVGWGMLVGTVAMAAAGAVWMLVVLAPSQG